MIRLLRRAALTGLALMFASPVLLWAHARLTRSDPLANARLEVAPTAIRLWFSESPELSLSSITLRDSAGVAVRLGAIQRGETSLGIAAPILDTLKAGRYTVGWRVAASDGHPTSGSFSFVSLATVVSMDTLSGRPDPAPRQARSESPAGSVAYVAARAAGLGAVLIAIGAVVFNYLILARLFLGEAVREAVRRRLATAGLVSTIIGLMSAATRLLLEWQLLNGDPAAAEIHMSTIVVATQWGTAWIIQVATLLLALVAFGIARRGSRAVWALAAIAATIIPIGPALGGHAAADAGNRVISVAADIVHVLAASAWLGALFCLVVVAVPVIATQSEDGWKSIASLVDMFSPVALTAASALLATGIVSAWLRLGSFGRLWSSDYGRALLVKLALVVGVAVMGAYNWKSVGPALGTDSGAVRFRKSAMTELAFGVAVLVVTAVLVALPTGR